LCTALGLALLGSHAALAQTPEYTLEFNHIQWQEELASKYGLEVLSFSWVQGYRHFFTKQIKTPANLAGLRIRTPPASSRCR
jgi:hypothetical protein